MRNLIRYGLDAYHCQDCQRIIQSDLLDEKCPRIEPDDHHEARQADHEQDSHNGRVVARFGEVRERDIVGNSPRRRRSRDISWDCHGEDG